MGKLSRKKHQKYDENGDRVYNPRYEGVSGRFLERMDPVMDRAAQVLRNRYIQNGHWARLSGGTRPEDIDYTQPNVHLEWILCDQRVWAYLVDGNREKAFELMDESQIDTYLHGHDIYGSPYTNLEKHAGKGVMAKAFHAAGKEARRQARDGRTEPTEEDFDRIQHNIGLDDPAEDAERENVADIQ